MESLENVNEHNSLFGNIESSSKFTLLAHIVLKAFAIAPSAAQPSQNESQDATLSRLPKKITDSTPMKSSLLSTDGASQVGC